jgi:hypothetical protein
MLRSVNHSKQENYFSVNTRDCLNKLRIKIIFKQKDFPQTGIYIISIISNIELIYHNEIEIPNILQRNFQ